MIDVVVEVSDRRRAGGGVAKDARRFRQRQFLLVHAHHFGGGPRDEQIDLFEGLDHGETFLEEMPRSGERPTPARRFDFGQRSRI
jgi:hypothetical protein